MTHVETVRQKREDALPLDGYVRISRQQTTRLREPISPAVQEEMIRAYIAAQGEDVGLIHHELGRPVGTGSRRPVLEQAVVRVEEGCSGGLVVARVDRFARSVVDALEAIRRINGAGGRFISVSDGLDSATPWGRAIMSILLALAELELARLREGWSTAQARAVERGVHISGTAPIGYLRNANGVLVPDPATKTAVLEAFRLRACGERRLSIRQRMDALTVDSGGRRIQSASGIAGLLSNPVTSERLAAALGDGRLRTCRSSRLCCGWQRSHVRNCRRTRPATRFSSG